MSAPIVFLRRLGPDPHAKGAKTPSLEGCPDIFELDGGDFERGVFRVERDEGGQEDKSEMFDHEG